jgi:hypothetical protein
VPGLAVSAALLVLAAVALLLPRPALALAPLTLTGSVSPQQLSYIGTLTYTASASGGDQATIQYAFFRRRPGGTWIPDVNAPTWQSSNVYGWHPTLADVGVWETYIWVKDSKTAANANTYGYAAGYNTQPIEVFGPPTAAGPTTVSCAYAVGDDCWVTGDFSASAAPSSGGLGSLVYGICRSVDLPGGWGGCDVNLTLSGGTSIVVSGSDLPADGYRRAYYFQAHDSAGATGAWNTPVYVRVDRYAPLLSASNASGGWFSSRTATVSASDGGSGLQAVRYSWNSALDGNCTSGASTSSGMTLTAPAGDNLLYLCARDNTGRVAQWSGQYRIAPMSLTGSISPSQASYLGAFTWNVAASGGTPATTQYAFFRRRPGGTWIPDVNAPVWQAGSSYTWHPTQSDVGTWETYVWVRDGDTPAGTNTYGYAAGLNTLPVEVVGPPTVPGATTVACAYTAASGDCWVAGDFTASVTASTGGMGSLVYQICRSVDATGGFSGCDVNLTLTGGTSILVTGTHLPADGYRRAYYFQAKDAAGALSGWNTPRLVWVDRYAPLVSADNASIAWFSSRTATVAASDSAGGASSNSGLQAVRYSWNSSLDAACTAGTATANGATLTAPTGDNVLYLCARDNVARVTQWSGSYRVTAPLTLTGTVSPAQASYLGTFTWTASATGGAPGTIRYAFFRRRPGGTWIPDVNAPAWQASNVYSWTPAAADAGTWETYIWVKDGNTPANANTYGYATGFNTLPIEVVGPPAVPGATTVGCAYAVADDCWVTGDFTASVTPATGGQGSLVYQICRSNDSAGGFAGCDVSLTLSGGTSLLVSGTQLPADGYRRAYLFQAKDSAGAVSGWNTPRYVRVDRNPPAVSATNASDLWFASLTATVAASDATAGAGANSGLLAVRYRWNSALDAACTSGAATAPGATLAAPVGDNVLYLCARDNVSLVAQWSGRYRVSGAFTLTAAVSPTRASYLGSFTWTASASGGDTATIRYAFFRRRPGGTWIPDVSSPSWQASNVYTWTPALADVGTWETYVWVKDGNTPASANTYGYAAGFNTLPIEVVGPPTVPGATTVACTYSVAATGDCWVTGDFAASVTASTGGMGNLVYQACRSNDSAGGAAGCDVVLTASGGTSITVAGADLPGDGYRRAYSFQAQDSAGAVSGWNTPRSVRVDRHPPVVGATNASDGWFASRTATVSAADDAGGAGANSGLAEVRYAWNGALDAGCTSGTVTSSGATLTAPDGDNMLHLCARDNAGQVGQWSGHYRVAAPLSLTCSVSPAIVGYGSPVTLTGVVSGGNPATTQLAFFRRPAGGSWIPDVSAASWQASGSFAWTPAAADLGVWETYVWVRDATTPADANTYGYAAGCNPGPIEVVVPEARDFTLQIAPSLVTIAPGGSAEYTISLTGDPGFTGTADLALSEGLGDALTFLSAESIGAGESATLGISTNFRASAGVSEVTVTATAGDLTHSATALLRVASSHKPVLTRITPDSFANGGHVHVTVEGSFLTGSSVSIAQEQPDPDAPMARVFPTAAVVSINPAGTSMEVDVDATDVHILDFYNLVVDNGADIEAIPFRVLPGGPLVDAWTPSQPQVGALYALSISGRNLAGTTLTASVAGRVVLHSVESDDTEITALLEVLKTAPTGPLKLIVADAAGRTVEVPITIVLPQQSHLVSRNLTETQDGKKLDALTFPRPAVWFQEFVIRDPEGTKVGPKGLRIQGLDHEALLAKRSRQKFGVPFDFYIHVVVPLVRLNWQKVIIFDPLTGKIGDAVLQAIAIGGRLPIAAFTLSAHLEVDLTIYYRLSEFGFTFPLFCIEVTSGIEVTGFSGFAFNRNYCRGRGWDAKGTDSTVSSGQITGGDCADVTSQSLANGVVEGTVEQKACCSQPIGVAMSGHTFTHLPWASSYSVSNPQAGTATPAPNSCPCPCTVAVGSAQRVIKPGDHPQLVATVGNGSTVPCDYDVAFSAGSANLQVAAQPPTHIRVNGGATGTAAATVSVPPNQGSAPTMVTVNVSNNRCKLDVQYCVIPTGETSAFFGWGAPPAVPAGSDIASFSATLSPSTTDFNGRTITESEVPGVATDGCYKPNIPVPGGTGTLPDYSHGGLVTGGSWTVGQVNPNEWGVDSIGFFFDVNATYAQAGRALPCTMSTQQDMSIDCPWGLEKYARTNPFSITLTSGGTTVQRGTATATPPH